MQYTKRKFYTNVKMCNISHFQCEQQAWEGLSKIFRVAWSLFLNELFSWRSFYVSELSHCVQLFRYQKNQNANDVHCILLKRNRMAVPLHSLQFFFFFVMALLFNVMSSNNNIHPLSEAICTVCAFFPKQYSALIFWKLLFEAYTRVRSSSIRITSWMY